VEIFAAQGAPLVSLTPVATGKNLHLHIIHNHKSFNYFVWTPLGSRDNLSLTPVPNLPPISTTLAKLVAKFAADVVDTGGKFAAGVIDNGGKFAAGVVDTGGTP
jgi:hypothetical protein